MNTWREIIVRQEQHDRLHTGDNEDVPIRDIDTSCLICNSNDQNKPKLSKTSLDY